MIRYEIAETLDVSAFLNLSQVWESLEQTLANIVEETGHQLIGQWSREAVNGLKNPAGYIQKIFTDPVGTVRTATGTAITVEVINNHHAVIFLEDGVNPFDLKKLLDTSARVKVSKKGVRYLFVPMHHSPNQVITEGGVGKSEIAELSGSTWLTRGQKRDRHEYEWGTHLNDMGDAGRKRKLFSVAAGPSKRRSIDYTWQTSPFERLYRFDANPKSKSLTGFRTMTDADNQVDAWWHPGIRSLRIAETAANIIRPQFHARVADALRTAIEQGLKS